MNNTIFPTLCMEATGLRFKEIFKEHNLRVEDVKDFLGLESTQAIYKWQQGKCFPSIDNLYALSHWLGIPINDMLMGSIELKEKSNSREREEDRDPLSFFAFFALTENRNFVIIYRWIIVFSEYLRYNDYRKGDAFYGER